MATKMIVDQTLEQILHRSASLYDRLSGLFVPSTIPAHDERADSLLEKWQLRAAGGDASKFKKRLSWEGHDQQSVRPLLGEVRLAEGSRIPGWVHLLDHCSAAARTSLATETSSALFLDPKRRMPYEEVFVSYVTTAAGLLHEKAGPAIDT